jgi:hypothetical protein
MHSQQFLVYLKEFLPLLTLLRFRALPSSPPPGLFWGPGPGPACRILGLPWFRLVGGGAWLLPSWVGPHARHGPEG